MSNGQNRRQRRFAKRRDEILDVAARIFAEKGFREVTVREIAAQAGVNSALVGYHFGNKQELFNEVYRSFAEPLARERMKRLTAVTGNKKKPSVEIIPAVRSATLHHCPRRRC